MKKHAAITQAEWEVLRVLWSQGASPSRKIIAILNQEKGWQASTIKTLLNRLVKKDAVQVEKTRPAYRYEAKASEEEAMATRLKALLHSTCQRNASDLLCQLLQLAPLDKDMKAQIEHCLAEKETVPEVLCTCPPGQCTCQHHTKPANANRSASDH